MGFNNGALMTLTIGQTAFNLAMKYTSERTNSGRPLNQLQKVAHRLVDMATVINICKASIYTAARLWDEDRFEESTRLSFMNKAFTTEQMAKVTHDAVVLHGAAGYNPDTTVGVLNFSQSKLAGICIWCAAAGFICLFRASYLGVAVFDLVGGIGLLILAIFLVYAGISELIGRTKTQAA